jgi:anaerobic ribonucleoside-triphosphate reductase activating protein
MKYAAIKPHDIANGPGIRVSFFASGCRHQCPGCFNSEARDFNFGKEFTQETIDEIITLVQRDYIEGLTLLGGEPFAPENQEQIWNLIAQVKAKIPQKSIRCYSGFTYEFINEYMIPNLPHTQKIMETIDVLVDGKWMQQYANLNLRFRGSSNQRVIDVQRTRRQGKMVWAL